MLAPRSRKVKILATLGPASSDPRMIRQLMLAGADAFRINMSHGDQKQKAKLVTAIRALEKEFRRPTTILFDLQGPKLRVGHFEGGSAVLEKGTRFIFDQDDKPGDSEPRPAAACRTVRVRPAGHQHPDRRRQGPAERRRGRRRADRLRNEGRRRGLRQQGRQRSRRPRADPGADRQGPRRPRSSRSSSGPTGLRCRSSSGRRTWPRRAP